VDPQEQTPSAIIPRGDFGAIAHQERAAGAGKSPRGTGRAIEVPGGGPELEEVGIGKTALARHFLEGKPHALLTAHPEDASFACTSVVRWLGFNPGRPEEDWA